MMFSAQNFFSAWDNFFYRRTDGLGLCLFRIFLGSFLVLNGLSLAEDFSAWYGIGAESVFPLTDSFNAYKNFRLNLFHWFPATEGSARFILWAYIITSFTFMIGLETRKSAISSFLLLVSLQNRNYAILNSGDTLLRCLLFLMMFAPSHVALSFDSWRRKRAGEMVPTDIPITTIRLLQLQFSIVYLATTLFKLKGYDWVDGTAVYYTSRLQNFQRFILPVVFDQPALIRLSTWSALFIEFSMGTLVWIKELRRPVLIAGIVLHLVIEVTMSIGFFEWLMMSVYVIFLTPRELLYFQPSFFSKADSHLLPISQ